MKAGIVKNLVLNMITTNSMIQLGKVKGMNMVDIPLRRGKLVNRRVQMIMNESDISLEVASE